MSRGGSQHVIDTSHHSFLDNKLMGDRKTEAYLVDCPPSVKYRGVIAIQVTILVNALRDVVNQLNASSYPSSSYPASCSWSYIHFHQHSDSEPCCSPRNTSRNSS